MRNGELAGRDPRTWPVTDAAHITAFFREAGRRVVYFAGYGELGYADRTILGRVAEAVLTSHCPDDVYVHCGTLLRAEGEDGITEVYRIAKRLGFETTGIHPSVAMRFFATHRVSDFCDHVFFVRDEGWGGTSDDGAVSPTLRAHLAVADEMVIIGGGRHGAHELRAFCAAGKPVRYVPAEMNAAAARAWCRRAGIAKLDLRGEVWAAWPEVGRLPSVSRIDPATA